MMQLLNKFNSIIPRLCFIVLFIFCNSFSNNFASAQTRSATHSDTTQSDTTQSDTTQSDIDQPAEESNVFVAQINMDMLILPGTASFLSKSIKRARVDGAKLLIVSLNTPGGLLSTSQEMIKEIFAAKIPVIIYVGPSGSTATSAGVFITMAGHVAAMATGTSLGAAHPVDSGGDDIKGDMRLKAENMTTAMVKSITEQRGRNVDWVEKAVRESASITEKEALDLKVIDLVAKDLPTLLTMLSGMEVEIKNKKVKIPDLNRANIVNYEIDLKDRIYNVLANPQIAALLWLGATTGLSIELYHPGGILPGVVGVICLILALAVSQIIPVSQGAILLIVLGTALITAEMFFTSGILGIGGIVSLIIGVLSIVDLDLAPGMQVSKALATTLGLGFGSTLLFIVYIVKRDLNRTKKTGVESLIGARGHVVKELKPKGRVLVNGAYWTAITESENLAKGAEIEVMGNKTSLCLIVKSVS